MYWLKPFYSFRGRTNRARFWLVSITASVYSEVLMLLWDSSDLAQGTAAGKFLLAAAFLPAIVSCLAVCVTRLHDRNKSAWWLVPFLVAPMALETVAQVNDLDAALTVGLMVLSGTLSLWALVELGVLRGSVGANAYGPDPVADMATA